MPLFVGSCVSVGGRIAGHTVYSASVAGVTLDLDRPRLVRGRLLLLSDRATCLAVSTLNQNPYE